MPYDDDRRHLADTLDHVLGERAGATLMSSLPPVPWHDLATKHDLDALGRELRGEVLELRGEVRGGLAEVRGEMAELRGEMAELRAEVRSLAPRVAFASLGSSAALFGLVAAAVAVFG